MSKFIVYYKKNGIYADRLAQEISAQDFFRVYAPVEILNAKELDLVYYWMQGENWSPNGEMREFIKAIGVNHTSMTVGDVIYSLKEDKFYIINGVGFSELVLTTQ